MSPSTTSVKVWGDFALFTRPELKVERLSYPFMTPSAARGIFDAIMFKPQMRWHVRRITALRPRFPEGFPEEAARLPYRLIAVRRNEINDKISSLSVGKWMKEAASFEPYLVDSAGRESIQGAHRAQRNTLALHHVAYRIDATPILTERANQPRAGPEDQEDAGRDTVAKYRAMFNRRVERGQCFHRPYLGCREFACYFAPPAADDMPLEDWNEQLGLMLYDIRFGGDGDHRPGFFQAAIVRGVLHCDSEAKGPNNENPITVFGWDEEGGGA